MAASTGSPASRRSTKLTPLTTRPSLTSRQGITRILNIIVDYPSPLIHHPTCNIFFHVLCRTKDCHMPSISLSAKDLAKLSPAAREEIYELFPEAGTGKKNKDDSFGHDEELYPV